MTRHPRGLPAKVVRPACSGALPRGRLFRLLDRARRNAVVWVSGPPGSGKTTLVSSYVEARRARCLWYRADAGDADAATFFHYMGIASRRTGRGRRAPVPLPPHEFRPDPGTFARRYFENLCGTLEAPALIVLDDLQEVPDGSPFFEVVRDGAGCLAKGITLVLVSRAEPPAPLVRLRARNMISVIGWDSLRLTAAETKGVASRRGLGKAGADVCRRLHALTDGWAAGVVLMLSAGAKGAECLPHPGEGAPGEIFDFFAEEILRQFDGRERNLLLALGFLPEATASAADEATGFPGAGTLLAALARRNAFVERRPGADPVYTFHSLFRSFLIAKARATLPPEEVLRLQRSAAAVLEERGRADEAVTLLREAGDWAGLSRVIRKQAALLAGQGRGQTLAEWLSMLPAAMRDGDPWLSLWWAEVRLPYEAEGSRRRFEQVFREFVERREPSGVFLAWTGVVESIMHGFEGLKPLDAWIVSLDGLVASFGGFPDEAVAARTTLAMLKALSLRRPPLASAGEWEARARAIARSAGDGAPKIDALVNLGYYWYHGGEFRETETVIASLRRMAARPESAPLCRLAAAWVEASNANMLAQHDRCLAAVTAGLDLATEAGIHVMDFVLMGHGALAALHKGDARTARDHLRAMEAALGSARPWEAGFYHFAAAWEALGRGDVVEARLHGDSCLSLAERVGNPWTLALAQLQQAFLCHEEGRSDASEAALSDARRLATVHGLAFARFACLLAEAFLLLERGEDGRALPVLREGMRVGREKGYDGVFVWRPGLLERLTMTSLERGIEVEYAGNLVRKNGLRPPDGRQEVEAWPWPIEVRTLGKFEVRRDGRVLSFGRRAPGRPLLLLKALIALGGRDVPEVRLCDLLWPDSDGDMAGQSFRTNLLRLRKFLGDDVALALRGGCLSLDDRYCRVDAWAMERLCRRIEELRPEAPGTGTAAVVDLVGRIAALYRGEFLPQDGDNAWTAPPRQRLRNLFARSVLLAGERLEGEGDFAAAAACYEKGAEAGDPAVDFRQPLIACYRRLGRLADARKIGRSPAETP